MVEDLAVLTLDAVHNLGKAYVVAALLEPVGAPDYVEQHFELGAGQMREEVVKEIVRYLRRVRRSKPLKYVGFVPWRL